MKKLMVFALALASVGAVSADCSKPTTVTQGVVYNVKFSGKTTTGGNTTVKGSATSCSKTDPTTSTIRIPASLNIEGWVEACDIACEDNLGTASSTSRCFWMTKPGKSSIKDSSITYDFLNVIGKSKKDAEALGTFKGTLTDLEGQTFEYTFAGLGKFDTKNTRYTSICGSFAGKMSASYYVGGTNCVPSQVWKCTALTTLVDSDTMGYGTWCIKYNSAASKKAATGAQPKSPSYAVIEQ